MVDSADGQQNVMSSKKPLLGLSNRKIFCEQSSRYQENCRQRSFPTTNCGGCKSKEVKLFHHCEVNGQRKASVTGGTSKVHGREATATVTRQKTVVGNKGDATPRKQLRSQEIFSAFGRTLPSPRLVSPKATEKTPQHSPLRRAKDDQCNTTGTAHRGKGRETHSCMLKVYWDWGCARMYTQLCYTLAPCSNKQTVTITGPNLWME